MASINKKIIIWGAGKKGISISERVHKDEMLYFVDCDKRKIGRYINGYLCLNPENILKENPQKTTIICTVNMKDQSVNNILGKWEKEGGTVKTPDLYFDAPKVKKQLDEDLLSKYYFDFRETAYLASDVCENWYRSNFFSERNKELLSYMKFKDKYKVGLFLDKIYEEGNVYFDEYYDMRPGMRLVHSIIRNEFSTESKIVDFACGHGELIGKIADDGYRAYAIDYSKERIGFIKRKYKVDAIVGNVESTEFSTEYFDVAICLECLEHVMDVTKMVKELIRTVKKGGMIFVTVPYMKNCDCDTHVRHFDESKLAGLFINECEIVNILKIPYLNNTYDDNLFIACKKK